ncbi:hypothetical protein THF1C08_320120 [Vibrio jasicida]|uniref:Uncharacterized protein n=1 Tax=Vibrio jasicida TaxID=766224 RepID=A0AAU9QPL4_9VIBR|nr:hypothetical protein THF1C08_320120 [Vibrio jasicida]CAH1597612.1 hypothetical protein THF1A12_320121 [Vibrio jasicida]
MTCAHCEDGWFCTNGCISQVLKLNPNANRYLEKRKNGNSKITRNLELPAHQLNQKCER